MSDYKASAGARCARRTDEEDGEVRQGRISRRMGREEERYRAWNETRPSVKRSG